MERSGMTNFFCGRLWR